MHPKKAVKEITTALDHYADGLISEPEFVSIGLLVFDEMRERIVRDAKHNLQLLGEKVE